MRIILLFIMSGFYILAGLNHFISAKFYLRIIPAYLPGPMTLVYLSGILEIVLGALLIPASTRRFAAWGIIILLVAIFPANIQMMFNYKNSGGLLFGLMIARLPLQILFILWAKMYTEPI